MTRAIVPAALRVVDAAPYCGMAVSTFWRRTKEDPGFPRPRRIGPNTVVWLRDELDAWLAAAPVAMDVDG